MLCQGPVGVIAFDLHSSVGRKVGVTTAHRGAQVARRLARNIRAQRQPNRPRTREMRSPSRRPMDILTSQMVSFTLAVWLQRDYTANEWSRTIAGLALSLKVLVEVKPSQQEFRSPIIRFNSVQPSLVDGYSFLNNKGMNERAELIPSPANWISSLSLWPNSQHDSSFSELPK